MKLHEYSIRYTIRVAGEVVETKTFAGQSEDMSALWTGWPEMRDRAAELGGRVYRSVTETAYWEEEFFQHGAFLPTRYERN